MIKPYIFNNEHASTLERHDRSFRQASTFPYYYTPYIIVDIHFKDDRVNGLDIE